MSQENTSNNDSNVVALNFVPKDDPKNPVLRLHQDDQVGVALRALKPDEEFEGFGAQKLKISEPVPKGHKVSLQALKTGDRVLKYAQLIGYASSDIAVGEHIHTHNLEFRNTDHVYEFAVDQRGADIDVGKRSFEGYKRADGRVGTRNYIAVISSVNCSATAARYIAAHFDAAALKDYPNIDGVVAFTHATGCGLADSGDGFDNLQRVFKGYAIHPNVAAVLIVGLM